MNNLWTGSLLTQISETGLGSSGLRTSTLTPEPSEPPPWLLTLKSYVTGEPFTTQHGRTTLHSHWLHFRDGRTASFRPTQRALFQKLCSETQERLWALQRSLPWQLDRKCLNKGDARPSPSHPPIRAGLQKCLCGPRESWCSTDRQGGAEITSTCPVSWKSPSCFSILYNNLFFFLLQTWDKECLGKRNSPTYFYSQEHALTAQGQRPTSDKGPVQSL